MLQKHTICNKSTDVWCEREKSYIGVDCVLSVSETEKLINEWIFSERNRNILKRRMLDGITYERIAEEFDMSVSQIKRIVKECKKIINQK